MVDRLNNHPAKVVFNANVGFIFDAFRLVFRDLTFTDDFVCVDACWVRSWICWNGKSGTRSGEGDVFCFIDYHANVAMLSASILGCDAPGSIG